jgi:hypothetical protein
MVQRYAADGVAIALNSKVRILPLEPKFKLLTVSSFSSGRHRLETKCQQICQQNDREDNDSHELCRYSAGTL